MDITTLLLMVGFAYAVGIFWYELLPGRLPGALWCVAAYPFALIVLFETFLPIGPKPLGFHPGGAVIAALIGVLLHWQVSYVHGAAASRVPAMRGTPAHR
jgi:hypothetical protein